MRIPFNARQLRIFFLFVFLFPYITTAEEPKFVVVAPKSSTANADLLCTEQDRQDAFKGETLTEVAEITAETIEQIGDGYWEIDVTNFDPKSEAKCKLTITIEEQ